MTQAKGKGGEPTHVIALRHGETAWNVDKRIQGHLDVPLNDTGRWQAQRLAQALADEAIAAVYASDLRRAFDTARCVAEAAKAPLVAERALRERAFGHLEGVMFTEIDARWPEEAARWRRRDPGFAPGGGETLEAFYARCVGAASTLAARHPGQTIALVAHGGVLDCLYRAAVGVELQAPRTWHLGNAAVNRLLWHGEGFTLVGWNDDRHLAHSERDPEPA
jgi:probable phosphoglycerate mutase